MHEAVTVCQGYILALIMRKKDRNFKIHQYIFMKRTIEQRSSENVESIHFMNNFK